MPAESLTLELTESMVMSESQRSLHVLGGLTELGVCLSCDDFGTGYSSLAHLRRLPIGEIKIDKSFIARMTVDESDRAIARSVLALGRDLGLVTVAEGVESREGWDLLADAGLRPGARASSSARRSTSRQFREWLDRRPPDELAYLPGAPLGRVAAMPRPRGEVEIRVEADRRRRRPTWQAAGTASGADASVTRRGRAEDDTRRPGRDRPWPRWSRAPGRLTAAQTSGQDGGARGVAGNRPPVTPRRPAPPAPPLAGDSSSASPRGPPSASRRAPATRRIGDRLAAEVPDDRAQLAARSGTVRPLSTAHSRPSSPARQCPPLRSAELATQVEAADGAEGVVARAVLDQREVVLRRRRRATKRCSDPTPNGRPSSSRRTVSGTMSHPNQVDSS